MLNVCREQYLATVFTVGIRSFVIRIREAAAHIGWHLVLGVGSSIASICLTIRYDTIVCI